MRNKKNTGGLTDDSLIQPEDGTVLGSDNLIDTSKDVKVPEQESVLPETETKIGQSFFGPNASKIASKAANPLTGGLQVSDQDFDNYSKYIDRPFSINESDIDDTRAKGQGLGEKIVRSYGAQLPVGIVTNVLGTVVGLPVGLAEVVGEGFKTGFDESSTWGKFFNNDFQRSLDGVNESVRESLPNYYTSQEAEYGAFKAAFGPGAANFWTDGLANGLSFVAGAVLSEYLTMGLATALIPARAAKALKGIAAIRNVSYGRTAIQGGKNLQRLNKIEKITSGLGSARRFMTGAMYESGVEARHNYDSTIGNLVKAHTERTGQAPTEKDMLNIKQIAHATSNGVFAANAALVGYSNMLMFPRIFGRGMRGAKKSLRNKFNKIDKGGILSLVPKYKDYNSFRKFTGGAYNVLKTPMYEGFVEEGGQKLADIAGQKAAEQYYADGKNPTSLEAVGGLMNNAWDSMGEAYGSPEGQKEIFLGFILGGLGLPSFVKTNKDTGKQEFGIGWQGGIKDSVQQRIKERKDLDDLASVMNNNPDALQAIKTNFDLAVDNENAVKDREYALLTENDFAYKNAEHDAFFSHVYHRMKAGYFGDVIDGIKDIQDMDNDAFEEMFDYTDKTSNMSKDERVEFLENRKNTVAEQHIERANEIKKFVENTDSLNVGEDFRKSIVHAYSSSKNSDAREKEIIEELTSAGFDLSAEVIDDISANDKKENEGLIQRIKNFTMKKLGVEAVSVMEDSETGRRVKKELGIKEFTEPGHPVLVHQRLSDEIARLKEMETALEAEGKQDEAIDVAIEIEKLTDDWVTLSKAIHDKLAPDISSEEQQVLDKFEKENPAEFLQNKEEYVKKLQDLRNLRAQRHRMLNLVQQLVDPEASADKRQLLENYIQDITQEDQYKGLSAYEKSLFRKFGGKVVEFDYTKKDGTVKRYRGLYNDHAEKGLVVIPDAEVYKTLKSLERLEQKKNKTAKDKAKIDELTLKLKGMQSKFQSFNPANTDLSNFKVIDESVVAMEELQLVLNVLEEDIVEDIKETKNDIYETQFKLLELAEQAAEVLSAIQNAKNNKNGKLYVNLNAIGKKGNFSKEGAQKILADIKAEEDAFIAKLDQIKENVVTLTDYSDKMQVIHSIVSDPGALNKITGKPITRKESLDLIKEFLASMPEKELFKDLLDKGYFTDNSLSALGVSNTKEGKKVDIQIMKELFEELGKNTVPSEYLDLINSELTEAQENLNNLIEDRKLVEKRLNKYFNLLTPYSAEGFTEKDERSLQKEIQRIDNDVMLLTDTIAKLSEATEEILRKDARAVQKEMDRNSRGIELQKIIYASLSAYMDYIIDITTEPAEPVKAGNNKSDEAGIDPNPSNEEGFVDKNNVGYLSIKEGAAGFLKTAGSHKVSIDAYKAYEERKANGDKLSPAEEMHYESVMSQLRFFKASEDLTQYGKKDGARLMIVHRDNIPKDLKDKIVFYDRNKNNDPSSLKRFVYAKDLSDSTGLSDGSINDENEDIKLVLVNKDYEPILVDGELAYTSMPTASLYYEGTDEYMYNKSVDLNEEGVPYEDVKRASITHASRRKKLLESADPLYYFITGKSKSMPIQVDGDPAFRGSVIGRIEQKEKNIKDIQLVAATGTKGEERANISIGKNIWNVRNGFLHISKKGSRGIKNNVVRGIPQKLGKKAQDNVYNLLRLYATQVSESKGADLIGGQGIQGILKNIIYFGKQAKDRELKEYSIWMEKDSIHYGESKSISFEELIDPKKYTAKHDEFKGFLEELIFNANSFKLSKDEASRQEAKSIKYKAIKSVKGRSAEATKERNKIAKQPLNYKYEGHTEVIVDENLEVTTREWANYTEYLLSDVNRDISDVPVTVNMNLDMSSSKNVLQSTVPQFLNMYLLHEGSPISREEAENEAENQGKAEENAEDKKLPPGFSQGNQEDKNPTDDQKKGEEPSDSEIENMGTQYLVIGGGYYKYVPGSDPVEITKEEYDEGVTQPTTQTSKVEKIEDPEKRKASEIELAFKRLSEGIGESSANKIKDYVDRIIAGEEYATITQGLGKTFKEGIDALLKAEQQNNKTSSEDESDVPFMLSSSVESESTETIDLDGQLKWFNANIPKGNDGKPVIGIELVRGLIDGKGYGKFTKDGNILLSDFMDVEGVLYHETWHAVTRRLVSKEDRVKMYKEGRKLRGKARTFKGEVKKLSEFTDKEMDEWLAEEFRAYVISDGNYKVGQNVKKSWLDRMFDRIFNALSYFTNTTSNAEDLMSKIHGGYFTKPTTEITWYDSKTEAYMEATTISDTMIANTVEGMTVQLFQLAAKQGLFEIEDLFDPSQKGKVSNVVNNLYGRAGQKNKVYNRLLTNLRTSENKLESRLASTTNKSQRAALQEDILRLQDNRGALKDNWPLFIANHKKFLERFKLNILEDVVVDENDKSGRGYDLAQSEMDPNATLPDPVRLLIATLPAVDKKGNFLYNNSGFLKLTDFGSTMAFLYKELSNTDPKFIEEELKGLAKVRPDLQFLVDRLGIETDTWEGKTSQQVRMINRVILQFDQANRKFFMQSITKQGGRFLLDNNSNRVDSLIKDSWKLNFKSAIQSGLGKIEAGKMIVNKNKKISINDKTKTFEDWVKMARKSPSEVVELLGSIGIKFSDPAAFLEEYNESNSIKDDVNWVFQEIINNPISDLYSGDVQGRLKSIIDIEIETTNYAVDLIHINASGKKVYGISLKTQLDVLASELNNDRSKVTELLKHANLSNSVYLDAMAYDFRLLEISVLEDVKQEFGRNKGLSKSTPADIAVMHVNAILGNGIMPIIRTADKKTEYGVSIGVIPGLDLTRNVMIKRLQGYLIDEIKTANIFNVNKTSKLRRIQTYSDQAGDLRYFKGVVGINQSDLSRKLSDSKILSMVQDKQTVQKLNEFLDDKIKSITKSMFDLNVLKPGKGNTVYNVGINDKLVSKLKERSSDELPNASDLSARTVQVFTEQLAYEHMTGVIEQSKLFLGDLAQYKDLFKRTAGLSGTKIYPSSDPKMLSWMNDNMPNLGMKREHSETIRTVTRADVEVDSPNLQEYIDVISVLNPKMLETLNENGENILEQTYNGMEEFDGGALMHLDSYRSILYRASKWSDAQERLYQKINSKGFTIEDISLDDLAYFPPLKPQVMAPFVEDNIRLMAFHKFALFPLIPQLMPNRAYYDINKDMENNNVDYMLFNSVAKVGAITIDGKNADPFYEETENYQKYKNMELDSYGEPSGLLEFDFSKLGIQVEIAPKIKENVSSGTQLTSLLPVNIYQNGEVSEKYKNSGLSEAIDEFHKINYYMIKKDIDSLVKELDFEKQDDGRYLVKDMKKLSEKVMEELEKRDMPEHTKRGIKTLFNSNNPFINQLFERDKLESIMYSIVTNSVIKRKMNGDMMVLQATTGLEVTGRALKEKDWRKANKENKEISDLKSLRFYRKNREGLGDNPTPEELANSTTLAMQVYLPSRFKGIINVGDARLDKELLNLIGFRIPTEGLNSVDFIEVVGFLPESAGTSIIVPTEMVGKAGADYDIDKLTMYFPNHTFNEETGEYTKIPYHDKTNSSVKERYDLMVEQKETDLSYDEFKELSIPEQNIKKALQNRVQDIIRTVLEHPASFDELITPVGAFEVKTIANEIAALREKNGETKEDFTSFNKMLEFGNLVNKSYRMWSGLGGVGIVAVTATGHAKAQRANLDWNPTLTPLINFEGEGFSLSRIYDVNEGMKISGVLAQYVTGYVDVTKEDFVFDINAGVEYAPVHMMLIRSGVPLDQVLYFMSQPIIDDYVKLMETQRSLAADYSGGDVYMSKDSIIEKLSAKYGKANEEGDPNKFNSNVLRNMIGKPIKELSSREIEFQAQILNDFIRYQEYADHLYLLNTATKYDTSRLTGPTAIKYMKAALARVQETNAFVNLENLLENDNVSGKFSLLSGFKEAFEEGSKMFASVDMKEFHTKISEWTYDKIYELIDPELRIGEDRIGHIMKRFDSHLSSYIVQNTLKDGKLLNERIPALFRGKNSLPRRILAAQKSEKLKNNLLITEFYPVLQSFEDSNNPEFFIDNLKLFSKKLQVFDVDLLANAYEELYEKAPQLAKDILEFSVLQSGFHYSPIAFFQVLPSTRVLELTAPYFEAYAENFNLNLDNVWEDFMQNSVKDGKIVTRARFNPTAKRKKAFKNGTITNKSKEMYINVSSPTGEVEVVGTVSKNVYETKLFKNSGPSENNPAFNVFSEIPIKGAGMNLIESGKDTILKNSVPLGNKYNVSGVTSINKRKWTKDSPKQNPSVAYVFTENINSAGGNIVGGGSAIIRNNPNAIGVITKKYYFYGDKGSRKGDRARPEALKVKNSYKGKGNWYDQNFQDTDSDFELFKKVNLEQFAKLDKFDSKIFPDSFANSLASIPSRFALWLQSNLYDRYGLITEVNKKGTGLISKSVKQAKETFAYDIEPGELMEDYVQPSMNYNYFSGKASSGAFISQTGITKDEWSKMSTEEKEKHIKCK
mgnify:FL=1